jgi:hypothetical protein
MQVLAGVNVVIGDRRWYESGALYERVASQDVALCGWGAQVAHVCRAILENLHKDMKVLMAAKEDGVKSAEDESVVVVGDARLAGGTAQIGRTWPLDFAEQTKSAAV